MKCRKCSSKAAVHMRQHRLALCTDHFLEWVPAQVERFIKKYGMFKRGDRVLAAVSGGKDSLSLWDILLHLGYRVDGLYICLGINEKLNYSAESRRLVEQYASQHGSKLYILDLEQTYGENISTIALRTRHGRGKPCSICGLVKRHEMNRFARENGYEVLATGHNLDDEAAALMGNTLSWHSEFLRRQAPVLPDAPGLVRKVKPLCRIYEREMAAYAFLKKIEYIYEECPFAEGSTLIYHKELLNRIENEHPATKMAFYLKFLEARKDGLFNGSETSCHDLHPCPKCGQPTSAKDLCAFCRLFSEPVVPQGSS